MELWDVYDKNRNKIGKFHERGQRLKSGEYHLVADVWTVDFNGKILLTQRHPNKNLGLMWECTGGAVVAGETSLQGAVRELAEEVGIKVESQHLKLISSARSGECFIDTYLNKQEVALERLKLQHEEVIDVLLVTSDELEKMYKQGLVVPSVWERFIESKEKLLGLPVG